MSVLSITEQGIIVKSFDEIYAENRQKILDTYGQDIYIEPDSQDGQMLAIWSLAQSDTAQAMAAVFNAFSPTYSFGEHLSSLVKINGLKRNATQLKSDDGANYVEIEKSGNINIVSASDTSITSSGDITAENGSGVKMSLAGGNFAVAAPNGISLSAPNGAEFSAGGAIHINAPEGVFFNGKRIDEHVHGGIQPGNGTTGINQ